MIEMGDYSYITNGESQVTISNGVTLKIGKFTSVAAGLRIESGWHPPVVWPKSVSSYPFANQLKEVKDTGLFDCSPYLPCRVEIGNDVWIATQVSILDGVTIGDGAIVGAHAVVTKEVPPYAFVAGNPARIKFFRFSPKQIHQLEEIKWWDWDKQTILDRIKDFQDIDTFLQKYAGA